MVYIVLIFSALTFLAGIAITIKPKTIFRFLDGYSELFVMHVMAVILRLIIAVALISCSAQSKFSITLQIIGWLSLVAAIILALIGRQRFKALINWVVSIAPLYHHLGGFVTMVLGGFLFFAVM